MVDSHLYNGFRHVSYLPSIQEQRLLQSHILKRFSKHLFRPLRLLSVGVGYGDELAYFADTNCLDYCNAILAIDISEESKAEIYVRPELKKLKGRLTFNLCDVRDIAKLGNADKWDCIQAGFVMHDIEYIEKARVYNLLFSILQKNGILVLSDIFIDNQTSQMQVTSLYDNFLAEADNCLDKGIMNASQHFELCGGNGLPGLSTTKEDALMGTRDYFESKEQTMLRLIEAGFIDITYHTNTLNDHLGVYIARKP